ncbi:down syndrome cell adhesion molecule-like protein Dscam2 [Trichonephila clavipes]|nr:down syndrome cell adhesion molecule-like protein Dscam2 [Trichonephila clavipes]
MFLTPKFLTGQLQLLIPVEMVKDSSTICTKQAIGVSAALLSICTKEKKRTVICYLFQEGVKHVEIIGRIQAQYGGSCLSRKPIRVSIFPAELQLDVGKTANFNCSIHGTPVGSVTWKKDMRLLSANQRAMFPTPTSLQVRQVKRQDSGMYQCFVNRDEFSAQASSRLLIGEKRNNDGPVRVRKRYDCVGMRCAGCSVTETAIYLGRARSTVSAVMTAYKKCGNVTSGKHNSGRKRKLTDRDKRVLTRIVARKRKQSLSQLTSEVNSPSS